MSRRVKLFTLADLPLLSGAFGSALVITSLPCNAPKLLAVGVLFLLPAVVIAVRASFKDAREMRHG